MQYRNHCHHCNRLLPKITNNLVSFGRLLYLAFLHGWHFLNKISLDWLVTLTTQPSTSKLSDNPTIIIVTTNFLLIQIFTATCTKCTGKNNRFPFLDILGYLKNTHKNPKFGKVRQVPTREFPTKFPDWDLSHSSKFGIFVDIL